MIQQPSTNYLPVQQAAVQQQIQQGQVMLPAPAPNEFNAIKINISGATVGAPAQQACPMPAPIPTATPVQLPEAQEQKLNYMA